MPNLTDRMAKMEASAEFKALSPAGQSVARETLKNKVKGEYQALVESRRAKAVEQRAAMDETIGPKASGALHSLVAGGIGAADTATFGYLPKMVSALPGTGSEDEIRASMDVASESNPIATTVGNVVGMFKGPSAALNRLGGSAVGRVAGGAATAAGGGRIIGALENEFARRFAVATLKNLATGSGAIATNELLRNREDDAGLGQRLADAASMATNPVNLATSVVFGAAQAKLQRPPSADLASAVARYERITGKRVPIETLTDSASQKAFYDSIARVPGMEDVIQRQRKDAVAGLKAVVSDLRRQAGAAGGGREAVRGQAAKAVRDLVGDGTESVLAAERRTAAANAIGPIGSQEIPSHMFGRLARGWQRIKAGRPRNTQSPELDAAFAEISKLQTGRALPTLNEFEALRQQIGKIGHSTILGARDVGNREKFEARRAYDLISALGRRYYPQYGDALNVGKSLRAMESALGDVQVSQLDDAMLSSFFASKSAAKNWDTLVAKAAPEDVAAAKGWLFYRLMGRVSNADGYINPETLDKVTSRGELNSQLIDKVLPGLLPELRDHAKLTAGMLGKGAGRFGPVGSQTASRGARLVNTAVMGGVPAAGAALVHYLSNPFVGALAILGPAGVKAALRSALGGQIENAMQTLSRSGPTGITRSAVATQSVAPDLGPLKQSLAGLPTGEPQ